MKQLAIAIAFLALAVGCRGQVPPNPTSYSCPSSSGTAYTPLNQSSPTTSLTYTDSKPSAAVYCYIAQSVAGSQVSVPSNTAGPFAPAAAPGSPGTVSGAAQAIAMAPELRKLRPLPKGTKTLALASPTGLRFR